ncbi:MAG: dienelactone hydrolase family protein, partial [Pseudomonadota bacterium]
SQGEYDRGEGELSDAASALDWLQQHNPESPGCWVAGFSFGSWIGMQLLMRRPEIDGFISVAPPANMFDFTFLAPCPSSGLMLMGDKDELVTHDSVVKLVKKLSAQRDIEVTHQIIKGANHFFTEHLPEMEDAVRTYVVNATTAAKAAGGLTPPLAGASREISLRRSSLRAPCRARLRSSARVFRRGP